MLVFGDEKNFVVFKILKSFFFFLLCLFETVIMSVDELNYSVYILIGVQLKSNLWFASLSSFALENQHCLALIDESIRICVIQNFNKFFYCANRIIGSVLICMLLRGKHTRGVIDITNILIFRWSSSFPSSAIVASSNAEAGSRILLNTIRVKFTAYIHGLR